MRTLLVLGLMAMSACTLRPRYNELVKPSLGADGTQVKLVVLDPARAPLAGARIEMSEGKNRFFATSSADGTFMLPMAKVYRDENSVVVVTPPAGVAGYRLELAEPPAAPAPATAPAEGAEPVKM